MKAFEDFKKFAFKGNVVDLAVGVIIGGAFGKIVSALVADVVMPLVALVMPSGNWRENGWVLRQAQAGQDPVVLRYGEFMGAVVDFFIIALVLFLLVRQVIRAAEGSLGVGTTPAAPSTRACPDCLSEVPRAARRCRACTSTLASLG